MWSSRPRNSGSSPSRRSGPRSPAPPPGPAVTGITLGLVRQQGFARQNGRNQVFNHAGNLVGAALSGLLGRKLGLAAVFWLAVGFGVLSVVSMMRIPADAIDDDAARGLEGSDAGASRWRTILRNRALLVLAISLLCFHLGNGAMLPLLGMETSATRTTDPAAGVAITIVVAQGVMVIVSALVVRFEARTSGWLVLLVSVTSIPIANRFAALPLRQ